MVDNNKLMGLLMIAGEGLLLRQEHIKETRKWRKSVRHSLRKRDSKCSLFIWTILQPFQYFYFIQIKIKIMFPLFLYCTSGHCLSKSSFQLMLVSVFTSWNSESKRTCSAQVGLHCVLLKKLISVYWIKWNRFDFFHYTEIIFLSKNFIFW